MWPDMNCDWYPFQTPGLVSISAALFLGWLGTVSSSGDAEFGFRNVEFRILVGMESRRGA
jgi:cation/acetate symporter